VTALSPFLRAVAAAWRGLLRARIAWAAGLVLAAAACAAVAGLDAERKIIDIGNGAEPLTLDPQKASGDWENNIIGNMFMGLTTEDKWARPMPGMATHWEVSDDGLIWTFFLRDALWSDGERVTAYDFEFAFRRILDPNTIAEYASVLYPIRNAEAVKSGGLPVAALGVHAIDEKTLEIQLEHPAPYLPQLLMHYTTFPIPKHVVQRYGDAWIRPQNVVVNGPYTLDRWWSNYIVHLKKNPLFFDAKNVCFNHLYFYPTSDTDAAARRVERGELAWATRFPSSKIDFLRRKLPGYVRVAPYLFTTYLSLNLARAPFDDVRVRQALSLAIDREFLADKILRATAKPAYSFVPPNIANYPNGGRLRFQNLAMAERRAQALRLLQQAGYGPDKPLDFTFSYRNGGENSRVAVVLQADWSGLAPWVHPQLQATEAQIHYANLRAKNFQIGDGGWVGDYDDAQTFLWLLETSAGPQNYPGYSNPAFDRLMQQADQERDVAVRATLMARAEQTMLDDTPVIPLLQGSSQELVNPRITGYEPNLVNIHRLRWMCVR
jgi:oligopeptide transport system substrate-binding protein